MSARQKTFPGTDRETSDLLASDVTADETAIITALRELKEQESVSLEELAFLLGTQAAQLSRHLNGACETSLMNYLRLARALGYRSRIVFNKAEPVGNRIQETSQRKGSSHKIANRC